MDIARDASARRAIEVAGEPDPHCPKHMVYGPCGGVRTDEVCELGDRSCPFVGRVLRRWRGPIADVTGVRSFNVDLAIVIDLRVRPFDLGSIREVTARLAAACDAVLNGEHHARPDFPPTFIAGAVADAGGRPWVTLTCRDRNRVVLEAELEALSIAGVSGVRCVTGDARAPSVRPDVSQVFDLDSLRLTALAHHTGAAGVRRRHIARPTLRAASAAPARQAASWSLGVLVNHAGGVAGAARFVAAARRLGVDMEFIPCVSVFTDASSWRVLDGFPGLVLDEQLRQRVLDAPDVRKAGVDAAVEQAMAMLDIDGVAAVNLSGAATSGTELDGAAIMAEIADMIRDRARVRQPFTPGVSQRGTRDGGHRR